LNLYIIQNQHESLLNIKIAVNAGQRLKLLLITLREIVCTQYTCLLTLRWTEMLLIIHPRINTPVNDYLQHFIYVFSIYILNKSTINQKYVKNIH